MKTVILTIPEKNEKWFDTLFSQFNIKHKVLSAEATEELLLVGLIDEAMAEEGEVPKEKIKRFTKKYGDKQIVSTIPKG